MYSRNAQNKFFEYSTFAFLFAWFDATPAAKIFAAGKFAENENAQYPQRMTEEIQQLGVEAELKLQSNVTPTTAPVAAIQKSSGITASTTMALSASPTVETNFTMAPTAIVQMKRSLDK